MSRRRASSRYANGRRVFFGAVDYSYAEWGGASSRMGRTREMVLQAPLPEMDAGLNPVYSLPEEHNGRRERRARELEAERARMAPIADRRGVRATAACAVMAIVLVVMLSMFLYGRGQIAAQNAKVTRLESRIAKADEDYAALESSYEYLMSHTNVGMVAVQQGMVSSQGRASIKIRVPENMAVTPCVTTETVTADSSK